MNPIHALTSCFSKSYFNTIFQSMPMSSTWSVSFRFSYRCPACISLLPDFQRMSRSARLGVAFCSMLILTATSYWTLDPPPGWTSTPCSCPRLLILHSSSIFGGRLLHPEPLDAPSQGNRNPLTSDNTVQ